MIFPLENMSGNGKIILSPGTADLSLLLSRSRMKVLLEQYGSRMRANVHGQKILKLLMLDKISWILR